MLIIKLYLEYAAACPLLLRGKRLMKIIKRNSPLPFKSLITALVLACIQLPAVGQTVPDQTPPPDQTSAGQAATTGQSGATQTTTTQTQTTAGQSGIVQAQNRLTRYQTENLASDSSDENLINPWGLAFNPNGPAWIANNGTGTASIYDGTGTAPSSLPSVTLPESAGNPTGIVFNSSNDFDLPTPAPQNQNETPNNPARFIFATEDGKLAGWSETGGSNNAVVIDEAVPPSGDTPVYKGLALAGNGENHFLYATDFHNARIQVFDTDFEWVNPQTALGCDFTDPRIPSNFAPFGIQNINGVLYVTYARQDENRANEVAGRGLGYVNIFDANGCLIRRFASRGSLNAPWGVALAPANFGIHSNRVLIANSGDGSIGAFDLINGRFRAALRTGGTTGGSRLVIDGIKGIAFGNGVQDQPTNTLFITAGTNGGNNGVYGKIEAVRRDQFNDGQTGTGTGGTGTGGTGTGGTGTGGTGTGGTGTDGTGTGGTGTDGTGTGGTGTGGTGTGGTGTGGTGTGGTGTGGTGTGGTGTDTTGTGGTGTDTTGTGGTGTGGTGTGGTGTGGTGTGGTGTGGTGTDTTGTGGTGTGTSSTGTTGTGTMGTTGGGTR
jgi:uncharacterized protein (TIGR03118 family)